MHGKGDDMVTRDNAAASGADQMTPDQGKMGPGATQGPTAAATSDTRGAFGDAEREVAGDPVDSEMPVFDSVGAQTRHKRHHEHKD